MAFQCFAGDTADLGGQLIARLSAANLGKAVEVRIPIRVKFVDKSILPQAEEMVAEFERQRR